MRLDAGRVKKLRIVLWTLLVATVFSFLGLSLLSATNYYEVAYAKLTVDVAADMNMTASILASDGGITNGTVFHYAVSVNITNPSKRTVVLQFTKYQGILRDYIIEDLMGGTTGASITMFVTNFTFSTDNGAIAGNTVKEFRLSWDLSNASNPAFFVPAKTIMDYAKSNKGLSWNEVEITHNFVFLMKISDVPSDYTGPDSGYLIELPVIQRRVVVTQPGGPP